MQAGLPGSGILTQSFNDPGIALRNDTQAGQDSDENDYLAERLQKTEGYEEALSHIHSILPTQDTLTLLELASQEYRKITESLKKLSNKIKNADERNTKCACRTAYAFYMGMLERFLQSCLIDADRTNTANFIYISLFKYGFNII